MRIEHDPQIALRHEQRSASDPSSYSRTWISASSSVTLSAASISYWL